MKTELVHKQIKSESPPLLVVLCITGNERAVARNAVRSSVSEYIEGPVAAMGGLVDVFIVVGVPVDDFTYRNGYRSKGVEPLPAPPRAALFWNETAARLEFELRKLWPNPTGLIVGRSPLDLTAAGSKCQWLDQDPPLGQESIRGFFSQFVKVRVAYNLVAAHESKVSGHRGCACPCDCHEQARSHYRSTHGQVGWRYDWLVRFRTDAVFFGPLPPLAWLPKNAAYVPRNGMANNPRAAFTNDQVRLAHEPKAALVGTLSFLAQCSSARSSSAPGPSAARTSLWPTSTQAAALVRPRSALLAVTLALCRKRGDKCKHWTPTNTSQYPPLRQGDSVAAEAAKRLGATAPVPGALPPISPSHGRGRPHGSAEAPGGAPPASGSSGSDNSSRKGAGSSEEVFLPAFPRGSWCQWWLQRRFGAVPGRSSGALREVSWPYTVMRAEWLECERVAFREGGARGTPARALLARSKKNKKRPVVVFFLLPNVPALPLPLPPPPLLLCLCPRSCVASASAPAPALPLQKTCRSRAAAAG